MPPSRDRLLPVAAAVGAAVLGGVSTDPGSPWFRGLRLPSFYPPPQTFGIVWTGLYTGVAWAGGEVLARGDGRQRREFGRAFGVNMALNAAWSPIFFRAHRPWLATAEAAALTASTVDLARRAAEVHRPAGVALAPYAAWTAFATVLSGAIARLNPR